MEISWLLGRQSRAAMVLAVVLVLLLGLLRVTSRQYGEERL
jgi:hypothetical protein